MTWLCFTLLCYQSWNWPYLLKNLPSLVSWGPHNIKAFSMCQLCGFILCFLYFHFIVPGKSDCFNFSVDSWFKNFSFTFKHIYLLDNVFLLQDRKGRLRVWPPHLYLVMGTFMCHMHITDYDHDSVCKNVCYWDRGGILSHFLGVFICKCIERVVCL